MSVPFTTPALQAVTPLGILGYFREAEAAMTRAANNDQIADLQARAQVVNQIFQSVMDNCQKQITLPGKVVNKPLDAVIAMKIPKAVTTGVKIEQTGESFHYNALKGSVVEARNKALQTIEALQLSLQSSSPSPAPSEEEQAEPVAPEPFEFVERTNTPPPAAFEAPAAFSQFGTFNPSEFQGPFVFTAGQTDDAAPAALPSAEKEEDAIHAGFAPTGLEVVVEEDAESAEQTESPVPHLDLTALRQADQPARADGAGTPHSQAPSESESDDGEETPTPVSARSQQHSPAKQLPDDINVVDESDNSGDEIVDEDRKETGSPVGQPTDILVDDQVETTSRCRVSLCTKITLAAGMALPTVAALFREQLVQAGQTVVTKVTPHATALWTGVKATVAQRSSQLAGLAVTAWENVPPKEAVVTMVTQSTLGQALVSEDEVSPAVPGLKVKHVAQTGLAVAALSLVTLGYYASRKSKPKAD